MERPFKHLDDQRRAARRFDLAAKFCSFLVHAHFLPIHAALFLVWLDERHHWRIVVVHVRGASVQNFVHTTTRIRSSIHAWLDRR